MKVSLSAIKKIVVGAVYSEPYEEGIRFLKCTPDQVCAWTAVGDWWHEVALASTGIRIDFHTDSRYVGFTVRGKKCEVLINGLIAQVHISKDSNTFENFQITLPAGENRVTLVFSSHNPFCAIRELSIEDGAYLKPHTYDWKLLFIGDSITQGWNSKYDCLSYAYQTSFYFNAESVIQGVGGGRFLPQTFAKADFDPDAVIMAYGTNDFSDCPTAEEAMSQAEEYMTLVKQAYPNAKLFCITPIYRFDEQNKPMGTLDDYRKALSEIAEDIGYFVIDGYTLVPHHMDFFADAVHPNDLGFSLYAKNLIEQLLQYGIYKKKT